MRRTLILLTLTLIAVPAAAGEDHLGWLRIEPSDNPSLKFLSPLSNRVVDYANATLDAVLQTKPAAPEGPVSPLAMSAPSITPPRPSARSRTLTVPASALDPDNPLRLATPSDDLSNPLRVAVPR